MTTWCGQKQSASGRSGLQVVPMSLSHLCLVHLRGTARSPNLQGVLIASLSAKVHTKPWTTLREHLSFRHTKIIIYITVFWLKVLSYQVFQETGLFIWWVLSMCWCHWTMQHVRNEGWWAVRLHQSFEDTSKTFSSSFKGRWIPHIFCKNYLWHAQSIIELVGHPYM